MGGGVTYRYEREETESVLDGRLRVAEGVDAAVDESDHHLLRRLDPDRKL